MIYIIIINDFNSSDLSHFLTFLLFFLFTNMHVTSIFHTNDDDCFGNTFSLNNFYQIEIKINISRYNDKKQYLNKFSNIKINVEIPFIEMFKNDNFCIILNYSKPFS